MKLALTDKTDAVLTITAVTFDGKGGVTARAQKVLEDTTTGTSVNDGDEHDLVLSQEDQAGLIADVSPRLTEIANRAIAPATPAA